MHVFHTMELYGQQHVMLLQYDISANALKLRAIHIYIYTIIPEGVAEVSQIFLQNTHVLPKLVSYEEHCRRDRW
jgi:hypothetical protein